MARGYCCGDGGISWAMHPSDVYPAEPNNPSSARKGGGRTRHALIGGHRAGRGARDAQGSADGTRGTMGQRFLVDDERP